MGFLDALRRWSGDRPKDKLDGAAMLSGGSTPHPEFPRRTPAATPEEMAAPPDTTAYDREQWRRKLKRILQHLPRSEPEWDDLHQEAGALKFGDAWIATTYLEEFKLLVHQVVGDTVVTSDEHRKLDVARSLMGITDADAEAILHEVVAEAEQFFGKKVEGA